MAGRFFKQGEVAFGAVLAALVVFCLSSCRPADSQEPPRSHWTSEQAARLAHWAKAAPDDALPIPDMRAFDAAQASKDDLAIDRAANALALQLARQHLLGAVPMAQRAGWHIVDSDAAIDLQSRLVDALKQDGGVDGFFAGLRPLHPDFAVLRSTYAGEADPEKRKTLALNIERWRWLPQALGRSFVLVNTASFEATVWRDGHPLGMWPVVVGKVSTPSPVFAATITAVTFNPWWDIPPSIVREKHGNFPARQGYVRTEHDWRQKPGLTNALGQMKLVMPNPFNVYLHDTPSKSLFAASERAFSHGCIRVGDAIGFATALLGGTRSRETIDRLIASGKMTTISLPERLPVYVTYFTATVGADGAVVFKRDIYGRDAGKAKTSDCRKQGCSA